MTTEIDVLKDKQDIAALLFKYAHILDSGEVEDVGRQVFTDDAIEEHGPGMDPHHGPDEISKFLSERLAPFAGGMHVITNVMVEVHGDAARSQSYFQAFHWLANDKDEWDNQPADYVGVGMYDDELRRTGLGWRISFRTIRRVGPSPVGIGSRPRHLES